MGTLLQDVRYSFRMLSKAPGFAAISIITIALGIGANTAIFSLVNGILLRALPYRQPDQLVSVRGFYPKGAFAAMREQVRTMDVAAYFEGYEFNLSGMGEPVRLNGALVSAELLPVLGISPQLGPGFRPGDDLAGHNNCVILSYGLWQQRFAGDPRIIGRVIDIEDTPRQVVGVMPDSFRFPSPQTEIWIPLNMDARDREAYWGSDFMPVIGRLRSGHTIQEATAEIKLFQSRVTSMFPWTMPSDWNADVAAVDLQTATVGDFRLRLLILLGAVALVLLIVCVNVANLTLSRESARAREIAIRASLGAARIRIVRQLITESVVIAFIGGTVGLVLAKVGLFLLKTTLPMDTPRLTEVTTDWRVLGFTAAMAMLTGILAGLAPALQGSRTELVETLKAGNRGSSSSANRRLRRALVISELGLGVLLVSGAGLLLRSLWALSRVDPGFRPEHLATAHITPNESFCDDPQRCAEFYRSLIDKIRSLPGVSGAAVVNTLPLGGRVAKRALSIEGNIPPASGPFPLFWLNTVSADYFRLMSVPLLRGRSFTEADSSGNPPVAIVSAATARRWWPNQDVVGKHICPAEDKKHCYTVVGVVPDVRAYDLRQNTPDWINGTIYVPYGPKATLDGGRRVPAEMTLAVRTRAGDSAMGVLIRQTVASLSANTPVTEVRAMSAVVSDAMSAPRAVMSLFGSFAGLAFVLGTIGIYGVVSFFVGQRTREIGIRMALGAQRGDILKMVVGEGLSLTLAGVASGLIAALVFTRFLRDLLYGVGPNDPLVLAASSILFVLVALAACYVPARRAAKVDPMVALRYE
jgi:predicted permease